MAPLLRSDLGPPPPARYGPRSKSSLLAAPSLLAAAERSSSLAEGEEALLRGPSLSPVGEGSCSDVPPPPPPPPPPFGSHRPDATHFLMHSSASAGGSAARAASSAMMSRASKATCIERGSVENTSAGSSCSRFDDDVVSAVLCDAEAEPLASR